MLSEAMRDLLRKYNNVTVGEMSYGEVLRPGMLPPGTSIGNFSSLAAGLKVLRRNHTHARASQHPLFFNSALGLLSDDTIAAVEDNPLVIGNDVWVGSNVIVCPGCRRIGDGAIVGAGAVVTKDVPDFSIVAGNPARVIRPRFSEEVEMVIKNSKWWNYPVEYIIQNAELFMCETDGEWLQKFSRAFPA